MNTSGLATLARISLSPWQDLDHFTRYTFDVDAEWQTWQATACPSTSDSLQHTWFSEYADAVASVEVAWCDSCSTVLEVGTSDHVTLRSGDIRCEDCQDDIGWCAHCEEWFLGQDMTTVCGGNMVCDRLCLNRFYTWCESCEEYVDDHDGDHYHDDYDDCGCESGQMTFRFPMSGTTISNDSEHTVTIPEGIISEDGLKAVESILYTVPNYRAIHVMALIGDEWKTDAGTYPKRLARALHKAGGDKLSPEVLGQIGTVAREHSADQAEWRVSVTRDLNQSASDFYHDDSCWWGDYSESRCALKTNGGIGLRTWRTAPYGGWSQVTGRAWVMPMRVDSDGNLSPTYDATGADAFLVFNAYGNLEGFDAPRIVATMTGGSVRRVGLSISPMYVNSESGYLVASREVLQSIPEGRVSLSMYQHSSLASREGVSNY
jgi:hypothetical protein